MNTEKTLRKRLARPVLEGLESRELLSAMPNQMAEISALRMNHRAPAPTITQIANTTSTTTSTVPANGDVNPYGVAFVPAGFPRGGAIHPGDVLVANFNNSGNLQGTGTTIVRITPSGQQSVFFQAPATGFGLDTGLAVLKSGFVIVGSLPSTDGTSATAGQGSILVLDRNGNLVANLSDPNLLNGPWDLTVHDNGASGQVFVSNALSGTVSRFDYVVGKHGNFKITSAEQIASGYTHMGDPAAFELGPTGLAYDAKTGVLFVASTADNAIYAVPNASKTRMDKGTGKVIYADATHLHGPLGLTFAPEGNLIVANGDAVNADPNNASTLVEFIRSGKFVGQISLSTQEGGAFGVAMSLGTSPMRFAAVNDITNSLQVWRVKT